MQDQLIEYLRRLVQINSVNPDLSTDGQGEQKIAEYIQGHFQLLDIPSEIHTVIYDRCNMTAVLSGEDRDRILLLNVHIDTVGTEGMVDPFTLKKREISFMVEVLMICWQGAQFKWAWLTIFPSIPARSL